MRDFILAAIFITFFLAIGFIFFVVFSDVFYNPESGLETKFNESAESIFDAEAQETWNTRMAHTRFFFQLAGVAFVGLCFLLLIIYAFRKRGEGGEY